MNLVIFRIGICSRSQKTIGYGDVSFDSGNVECTDAAEQAWDGELLWGRFEMVEDTPQKAPKVLVILFYERSKCDQV